MLRYYQPEENYTVTMTVKHFLGYSPTPYATEVIQHDFTTPALLVATAVGIKPALPGGDGTIVVNISGGVGPYTVTASSGQYGAFATPASAGLCYLSVRPGYYYSVSVVGQHSAPGGPGMWYTPDRWNGYVFVPLN